jgi:hypothetical protein
MLPALRDHIDDQDILFTHKTQRLFLSIGDQKPLEYKRVVVPDDQAVQGLDLLNRKLRNEVSAIVRLIALYRDPVEGDRAGFVWMNGVYAGGRIGPCGSPPLARVSNACRAAADLRLRSTPTAVRPSVGAARKASVVPGSASSPQGSGFPIVCKGWTGRGRRPGRLSPSRIGRAADSPGRFLPGAAPFSLDSIIQTCDRA